MAIETWGTHIGLLRHVRALVAFALLLIQAGDVELNPGPVDHSDLTVRVLDLLVELISVASKWYHIGIQLEVDMPILDSFKLQHSEPEILLAKVLDFWLKENTPIAVAWRSSVEALRSGLINEKRLAKRLEDEFILDSQSPAESHDRQPTLAADCPSRDQQPITKSHDQQPGICTGDFESHVSESFGSQVQPALGHSGSAILQVPVAQTLDLDAGHGSFANLNPVPKIRKLSAHHQEFNYVKRKFEEEWKKGQYPEVSLVFIIENQHLSERFWVRKSYDPTVEVHFHGTTLLCDITNDQRLCCNECCGVCGVSSTGFDPKCIRKNINFQRFGSGFYLAPNSSKCHDYTQGANGYRATYAYVQCFSWEKVRSGRG